MGEEYRVNTEYFLIFTSEENSVFPQFGSESMYKDRHPAVYLLCQEPVGVTHQRWDRTRLLSTAQASVVLAMLEMCRFQSSQCLPLCLQGSTELSFGFHTSFIAYFQAVPATGDIAGVPQIGQPHFFPQLCQWRFLYPNKLLPLLNTVHLFFTSLLTKLKYLHTVTFRTPLFKTSLLLSY